jgi:UDP-N-acetylglucosamine 2-epimerase (non-hydrolysing)
MLGIPCLTLRESTERPITISVGTNKLVGVDPEAAVEAVEAVLSAPRGELSYPPLWDGHTAERIAEILSRVELRPV